MFRDLATSIAHGTFAKAAEYTPPDGGEAVSVEVVLHFGVEDVDRRLTEVRQSDFADFVTEDFEPEPGGVLSEIDGLDGEEYEIGKRERDDRHKNRWRITEAG